jgi:hypothetical protein
MDRQGIRPRRQLAGFAQSKHPLAQQVLAKEARPKGFEPLTPYGNFVSVLPLCFDLSPGHRAEHFCFGDWCGEGRLQSL